MFRQAVGCRIKCVWSYVWHILWRNSHLILSFIYGILATFSFLLFQINSSCCCIFSSPAILYVCGCPHTVQLLLQWGADVWAVDRHGLRPKDYAETSGMRELLMVRIWPALTLSFSPLNIYIYISAYIRP